MPWIQLEELRLRNAGITLKDQAMAQNLIYFTQREKQQKQLAMPNDVAQLMTAFTGHQVQTPPSMQHTPPLQQVLPPTSQQPPATLPPQPTGKPPLAEGMDMDAQGTGESQSDKKMDNGSRAHKSGSKGPMEDAKQT